MLSDLRHGWRQLAAAPVVSAVVVASLAVGIGVNTAVFSWIQVFALSPLPGVPRASEFQLIEPHTAAGAYPGASWREAEDLRAGLAGLVETIAFRMTPLMLGEAARTERAFGLLVSGTYFGALGVAPTLGRVLGPADVAAPGGAAVAVVSHRFWQSRLAGDARAVGRTVRVNGADLTVVGVLPDGFQGTVLGLQCDVWLPATMAPVLVSGSRELDDRRSRGYTVMARVSPPSLLPAVEQQAADVMRELAAAYPESNRDVGVEVLPYWRSPRGPQRMFLGALAVLQGLMLLLLLAVCGNTATLLVARSASRQRELAVRLAVGASPWRVARLLLAEALAVGLAGAVLGAVVAAWGVRLLGSVPLTAALPIRFQTRVDALGLGVALALGAGSAVVAATLPMLQAFRLDVSAGVAAGTRAAAAGRWRSVAVAAQVGLATIVLVVAGLFLGQFTDTHAADPGFERHGVLLAAFDRSARGNDPAAARRFVQRAVERLRALPGVQTVAVATSVPLDIHGLPQRAFVLEGRPRVDGVVDRAASNIVSPDYFSTMRMRWLSGAGFAPLDDVSTAPQVVVNQAFVDRYIGDGVVLGRRLEQGDRTYAIAGVVATTLSDAFGEPPTPAMYFSYRDRPAATGEVHVRTAVGAETTLAGAVRAALADLDPAAPVFNVRTLDAHVENNLLLKRIPARLFLVLGPLLLVLAASGIHAVVAHAVTARRTEIGVRLALGASGRRVIGEQVSASLGAVVAGAAAGWLLVWIVVREGLGVAADPRAFLAGPALLLTVAALSAWLPARGAASIDPVEALRRD
ncbi:MAG: ABC transporter permease [Vicinamibacterales bacterium]